MLTKKQKKFFDKYYDFSNPGSFSGISGFRKNNPEFKNKHITPYLKGTPTYTYHKQYVRKFPRNKFYAEKIDHMWQIDLIDLSSIRNKFYSQNYGFALTCIDAFSRYAWVEPMKNKTAEESKKALERIIAKGRKPAIIYSDGGSEFKGVFEKYCQENQIIIIINQNAPHIKAAIVERFNRTIKQKMWRVFTYLGKKQYSNILQKLVQSYNNSFHRSIGTAPSKVTKDNQEKIHDYQYGDLNSLDNFIEFEFKVGDYVRVLFDKDNTFEKGYVQKWSSEICVVVHQNPTNPPTYSINNTNTKLTLRPFYYAQELQKVQPEDFPYYTFQVEIHNNTATITQLNDENQETQVIENYKEKLRSHQEKNPEKKLEKTHKKNPEKRYSLRPRK
jgi:hypothetical protein